jgi:hypothetical protein
VWEVSYSFWTLDPASVDSFVCHPTRWPELARMQLLYAKNPPKVLAFAQESGRDFVLQLCPARLDSMNSWRPGHPPEKLGLF